MYNENNLRFQLRHSILQEQTYFVCRFYFTQLSKTSTNFLNSTCLLPFGEHLSVSCYSRGTRRLFCFLYSKSTYLQMVGHIFPCYQEERHLIDVVISDHCVQMLVRYCILFCQSRLLCNCARRGGGGGGGQRVSVLLQQQCNG